MREQAYTVRDSSTGGEVCRSIEGLHNEGQHYREPSQKGKGHVYWETGKAAERQASIGLYTRKQEKGT